MQVSLKSDKCKGYFTLRPMYIFDISLSSKSDMCFSQKLWRKSKHVFYVQ